MKTFTYTNQFGSVYKDCYFNTGRYQDNNNLAITIWNNEYGPLIRITVNTDLVLSDEYIAIKNYSENEGIVDWLIANEFIENTPLQSISSGWVAIPVYAVTEKFKEYLS